MSFSDLVGETLIGIVQGHDEIKFICASGREFEMYHNQDCCENVHVEDVTGDWNDVLGEEILVAEEVSNYEGEDKGNESYTWTFYKLRCNRGSVDIRWYGSSNGYYSERVTFVESKGKD
jgi:hypothetical protein